MCKFDGDDATGLEILLVLDWPLSFTDDGWARAIESFSSCVFRLRCFGAVDEVPFAIGEVVLTSTAALPVADRTCVSA